MGHTLETIAPIFLLIGLGAVLKARAVFDDEFWRSAEKLTFNVLFPALLFVKIAGADVAWRASLPIAGAIVLGIFGAAAAMWAVRPLSRGSAEKFVAMFQGSFRSNVYVGIAVAFESFGDDAAGPLAVAVLTIAVTINALGVWGHLRWLPRPGRARGWRGVLLDSLKNPLIAACLLGAASNGLGIGLPPVLGPSLDLMSRAALPLGLMAVGTGLTLRGLGSDIGPVVASCLGKLVGQPLLTLGFGVAFGLDGAVLAIAVLFAGLPTSSTSYVVSRQMGSDAETMAAIVTASHIGAVVTIPVLVALLAH